MVGSGFTVTVVLADVLAHPLSVPVTKYVVVEEGLSVAGLLVVEAPPDERVHKYVVLAPVLLLAVRVTEPLEQTVCETGLTAIDTTGVGLTVMVTELVPGQPLTSVPVTV